MFSLCYIINIEFFFLDLLIFSWIYGASESFIGLNLWPARNPENFLLWPWKAFYEFIPLENVAELAPKTLFMDQVYCTIECRCRAFLTKFELIEHDKRNLRSVTHADRRVHYSLSDNV